MEPKYLTNDCSDGALVAASTRPQGAEEEERAEADHRRRREQEERRQRNRMWRELRRRGDHPPFLQEEEEDRVQKHSTATKVRSLWLVGYKMHTLRKPC
jgi:hypothetical protein